MPLSQAWQEPPTSAGYATSLPSILISVVPGTLSKPMQRQPGVPTSGTPLVHMSSPPQVA